MHIMRAFWLIFLSAAILILSSGTNHVALAQDAPASGQRVVEAVDVRGNRRNRDEDLLYYVQTRPGDVFNPEQAQRDLQALLALNFFDKVNASVATEEGTRGGVIVVFNLVELPIIRDIQFEGLKSVQESDVLKTFRERRVGFSKEAIFDPAKQNNAVRVLKELLSSKGHPNATVEVRTDEISQTSVGVTFVIREGDRVRVAEVDFVGNQVFKDGALRSQMRYVTETGLIARFKSTDILDREKLEVDLRLVQQYMASKGYLQARTGEPTVEGLGRRRTGFFIPLPLISSVDETLRVTVPVTEGKLFRIGEIKIEGNSIFSEQVIRAIIGLKPGDVADGRRIGKALYEDLRKAYGTQGFIQYDASPQPTFKDSPANPQEGVVDFVVTIEEGKQFTLRRLEFIGNTFTRDVVLRREVLINEGDIYNQSLFEYSILRLNQLGFFEPVDEKRDADFRTNEEEGLVDINVKVSERGRQQISFNGGISGIGGSFFGLEYSTNNLLGRGESLSFQLAYGNRQQSFQFSFTEPYFRNRPITVGFSLFTYKQKFFGEGTFLSSNIDALTGLLGNTVDFLNVNEENLFTRKSYGASFFATAPLSEFYRKRRFTQFSRIGLSYQIAQSSVEDPPVNQEQNPNTFIPVIYAQPNILTSRVIPTFVYDTRNYSKESGQDPVEGKRISASFDFAGLGGDIRTYKPSLEYIQFMKVRRKTSDNPEVFGFRVLAATVGSFATTSKIRNSNSLAFINGVPIFERFFLGDEFTIRGYNVRSISPISPVDTFITSRNVVLASNAVGTPTPVAGLPQNLANIGLFTGPEGSNVVQISRTFTSVGGDTQLLGNFEYRIPLLGPVSMAAFADIGTAFNLRGGSNQVINSSFLQDQLILSTVGAGVNLSSLAVAQNPNLAFFTDPSTFLLGLVARDNRLASREEFANALRVGPTDPLTGLPFGFTSVFVRGEAQTNTVVRVADAAFAKFGDYRSTVGVEFRAQVPVINVPFRLIFFYNPNARRGVTDELPGIRFNEQRRGVRFSVGRTF
ncbi:MAG TPA: outer membrane protein assembly factor BamA [Pyrinomonadaceae bacterium]